MIKRKYSKQNVSSLTIAQIGDLIQKEGIDYAGDYGFEVKDNVMLIHSEN